MLDEITTVSTKRIGMGFSLATFRISLAIHTSLQSYLMILPQVLGTESMGMEPGIFLIAISSISLAVQILPVLPMCDAQ
jgi:hypothetical protein